MKPPVELIRNTETVDSKAFQLGHPRPDVVSLCLSENDNDDYLELSPNYHNVEFLITVGPGPCLQLAWSVLEGEISRIFGVIL